MSRFKFSLKWMLIVVASSAIAITSLVNASIYWASFCLSVAILLMAIGCLGALLRRGDRRAYWIGFASFGACYLVLVFAPGFDRVVGQRLVSTKVLGYLEPKIRSTPDSLKKAIQPLPYEIATDPVQEAILNLDGDRESFCPQWGHFQEAGHSAMAIILAIVGGAVARYFHMTDGL